jgi:uncharacterized protein (DUF2267 family)
VSTNILSLDRAVQNTVLWLNDIQAELHWEDRDMVYKATKAVLQTIRDRLPYEELFHFSANLPMIMKGMLIDSYDPIKDKKEKIKTEEEFYDHVQNYYDSQRRDIISAKEATSGVINTFFNRVGEGEMQKVADTMPLKLKPLFRQRSKPFSMKPISDTDKLKVPQV